MGAALRSLSVSEGLCLEPAHVSLSPAGVTARGLLVCHLGPWCPYPSADSARTQGSLEKQSSHGFLGSGRDYPVHPLETAVGTRPLDVGLLGKHLTTNTAHPRTFVSLKAIKHYCQCVGTNLASLLATARDAKRNRQERNLLSSNSWPALRPFSSQCH